MNGIGEIVAIEEHSKYFEVKFEMIFFAFFHKVIF